MHHSIIIIIVISSMNEEWNNFEIYYAILNEILIALIGVSTNLIWVWFLSVSSCEYQFTYNVLHSCKY